MSGSDEVTPPHGSGTHRVSEIARELAGRARQAALRWGKVGRHLDVTKSKRAHAFADELIGMADRLEVAATDEDLDAMIEDRRRMMDRMVVIKGELEAMGEGDIR